MFVGEYDHNFDAKGRIFIPVKFREELGQRLYLSCGLDKCISVYSKKSWQEFYDKISAIPDISGSRVKRYMMRTTEDVDVDTSGRILVPAKLRAFAEISRDVVVIGAGDKVEIWSRENFEHEIESEDIEAIKAQLKAYGM